ncbi:MAG: hypothetical protein N2594_03240 [Clostridiales bacterium]|nr:hypothetical protein [Clostridiales bacterium]
MSKLSSHEKFFIGRILYGLDSLGCEYEQSDVELLLSQRLEIEDEFKNKINNALVFSYCDDVEKFKKRIVTVDPESLWQESYKKLYKGRETVLRDLVTTWHQSYFIENNESFMSMLIKFFKR